MKILASFFAVLACALLADAAQKPIHPALSGTPLPGGDQVSAASDVGTAWSAELAAAQQAARQDTGGRARADAILRAVLDASRHGLAASPASSGPAEAPPAEASLEAAAAQAAYSALVVLYPQNRTALDARLAESLAAIAAPDAAIAAGRKWGEHVAQVILAAQSDAVFLNPSSFIGEMKAPANPSSVPEGRAVQAALGPGRYRFSILAGAAGTKGYVDGTGTAARFDHPGGIAVDAAGNVYVSEYDLCTIRKISPAGVVSTLAGAAGQPGSADGVGVAARFNHPFGIAVDGNGHVYVADTQNHTIRKIDPAGNVSTVAGKVGEPGRLNGDRATARLEFPTYLTVDEAGTVLVTEARADGNFNPGFRRVSPDGQVAQPSITIKEHAVITDGLSYTNSWFSCLTADHAGNLYAVVSDGFAFVDVAKFTPNAQGGYDSRSLAPPTGNWEGKSSDPLGTNWDWVVSGLAVDGDNNLYVKNGFSQIRRYAPNGSAEVHYPAGDFGGYWCDGMAADQSGRIFSLPSAGSPRAGTIEIGMFVSQGAGPAIILSPGDRTELRGDISRFRVYATGGSGLTYQWYFNASPISGATGATFTVTTSDGSVGQYYVVVQDNDGTATSPVAKLSLKEPSAVSPAPSGTGSLPLVVSPGGTVPPAGASGGGSFDAGISLAVLGLLAAAAGGAFRRNRTLLLRS